MTRPKPLVLAALPLVLLATGIGRSLAAQSPENPPPAQDEGTRDEERGRESQGLTALAWMEGAWQGSGLGGTVEEHWSRPAGGSMIGMFRLVDQETTSFAQYMLIEAEPGGRVTLRFQHFNPGFEPWEKDGPLTFELTETRAGRAVFESPDPKQTPARLVYSARGDKAMSAVIESPQALGGPISFEILFERTQLAQN